MSKNWWQKREKAGVTLLNITLFLVITMPKFILRICIFFVTIVYFLIAKDERTSLLDFYNRRKNFTNLGTKNIGFFKKYAEVYRNFYEFGVAICDKMAVWKGKITYDDLVIKNISLMDSELRSNLRGSILLVSHYGNIEITRALSNHIKKLRIVILVYQKNSSNFLNIINKVSEAKLPIFYVDDLNLNTLLELEKIIDEGGHIGIMGDRVAVSNAKNIQIDFLGSPCYFPLGAYLIAGILKTRVNALWCERVGEKYFVEIEQLSHKHYKDGIVTLGKDKMQSVIPLAKSYVQSLEKRVIENPQLWFNFYDYWKSDVKA